MKGGDLDYLTSRPTTRFSRRATSWSRNGILLTNYRLALHTRSKNNTKLTTQFMEDAYSRIISVHIRNRVMIFWIVSS